MDVGELATSGHFVMDFSSDVFRSFQEEGGAASLRCNVIGVAPHQLGELNAAAVSF